MFYSAKLCCFFEQFKTHDQKREDFDIIVFPFEVIWNGYGLMFFMFSIRTEGCSQNLVLEHRM